MKNKIIKILSVLCCVVILAICIFAFPASAAVGDVIFSTSDISKVILAPEFNDNWQFVTMESDIFSNAVLFAPEVRQDHVFYGDCNNFGLQKDKTYRFILPLAFSFRNNPDVWLPVDVAVAFFDSANGKTSQPYFEVRTSSFTDTQVRGTLYKRVFLLDFTVTANTIIDFPDIKFIVDGNEGYSAPLYMGIEKNNYFTITEVADSNTQAIIDNQNENTDKILNGGTSNPHYEAPDSSAAQQQDQLTQDIENSTSEGVDSANNLFSSFYSLLGNGSHIVNGLMGTTAIMNEFLGVPWLSGIITFALTLGIFSFLLGMGFFVGNVARFGKEKYTANKHSHKPSNWKGRMSSDERSLWV